MPNRMGRREPLGGPGEKTRTLPQIMALHERIVIIQTLQSCGGSRTAAARALGIRRVHLYRRMKILGIDLAAVDQSRRGLGGR